MDPVHVVVVTDEESLFQAIYVGGDLADQQETIYAADIVDAVGEKICQISHILVNMPDGVNEFPKKFEECMLWKPVDE